MKKIFSAAIIILAVASFAGCIKNDEVIYKTFTVELDAASWNANFSGLTYPIVVRKPAFNRAIALSGASGDSLLTRTFSKVSLRVNLLGGVSATDIKVTYEVFALPASVTAVSMYNTITGSATTSLPASNAVAGTHYAALSGQVTIPANTSFGVIDIPVLNPGVSASAARFVGIRLTSSTDVKVSENYKEVGFTLDQR